RNAPESLPPGDPAGHGFAPSQRRQRQSSKTEQHGNEDDAEGMKLKRMNYVAANEIRPGACHATAWTWSARVAMERAQIRNAPLLQAVRRWLDRDIEAYQQQPARLLARNPADEPEGLRRRFDHNYVRDRIIVGRRCGRCARRRQGIR